MRPRVLFVSKPIAPPFHDGTKCLVRDIANNLRSLDAAVLSDQRCDASWLSETQRERVRLEPVYRSSGAFHPTMSQNMRAALWVATHARSDLWHFVFAPNPRTSLVGRVLKRARRVPVVQTVASPPRSFEHVARLLFGDLVVAQSRWTRSRLHEAFDGQAVPPGKRPKLAVIPPPVSPDLTRSSDQTSAVRRELQIPEGAPVFVYPGDLEVSRGADTVAELVGPLRAAVPNAVVVFAYRAKSAAAPEIAERLRARLDPSAVRVTGEMPDVLALLAGAAAVLFPVDDLWGKVDLPIVLLESMVLGVPVVVWDYGPLVDLAGAVHVALDDRTRLLDAAVSLATQTSYREQVILRQRAAVEERFSASAVAEAYEQHYLELLGRASA